MKSKVKQSPAPAPAIRSLDDLIPDPENANQHTERGSQLMENSLRECGFGDSLTVDKDGVVISGNQRLETLADLQMTNPIVVQSDGTRPIVHQRTDLAIGDVRAKKLAIYQNRVGEVNLSWNPEELQRLAIDMPDVDLGNFWTEKELNIMMATITADTAVEDGPEAQIERADELQKEWKTEAGQLWLVPSKTLPGGDPPRALRRRCGSGRRRPRAGRRAHAPDGFRPALRRRLRRQRKQYRHAQRKRDVAKRRPGRRAGGILAQGVCRLAARW